MRIDFKQKLVTLKNEPLELRGADNKLSQITLGDVCYQAMLGSIETDRAETGASKYERWTLAGKIANAKEPIELKAEEIVKIKDRVGKAYGPEVVGPVYDLLEKKEVKT